MATRRDSGRKGGLTTLQRHGKVKMREWGKRGGRPRNPDYDDIRQRQALERQNNNEEDTGPPGNLGQLKRLYKLHAEGRSAEPKRRPNNRNKVAARRKGLPFRDTPNDVNYRNLLKRVFPGQFPDPETEAGATRETPRR